MLKKSNATKNLPKLKKFLVKTLINSLTDQKINLFLE